MRRRVQLGDIDGGRDELRVFDASRTIEDDVSRRQAELMTITTGGLREAISTFQRGCSQVGKVLSEMTAEMEAREKEIATGERKAGEALDALGITDKNCKNLPYKRSIMQHRYPFVRGLTFPYERLHFAVFPWKRLLPLLPSVVPMCVL